jgi:hypothetical protein
LSPLGRDFELVSASFTAAASREDIHRVIIAVSLPEEKPTKARPGRAARTQNAKARANDAADDQITRKFIYDRKKVDEKLLRSLR